jgi:hypothetical protein
MPCRGEIPGSLGLAYLTGRGSAKCQELVAVPWRPARTLNLAKASPPNPIPKTHKPAGSGTEEFPVVTDPASVSAISTLGALSGVSVGVEYILLSRQMNPAAETSAPTAEAAEGVSSAGASPAPAPHAEGIPKLSRPGTNAPGRGADPAGRADIEGVNTTTGAGWMRAVAGHARQALPRAIFANIWIPVRR